MAGQAMEVSPPSCRPMDSTFGDGIIFQVIYDQFCGMLSMAYHIGRAINKSSFGPCPVLFACNQDYGDDHYLPRTTYNDRSYTSFPECYRTGNARHLD